MYAVVEVGAKQYSVQKDDVIEVEKQAVEKGKELVLDRVLLVSDNDNIRIGQPYLKDAQVKTIVLGDMKAKKAVSYKYRRRKAYHRKKGHRQQLTRIKIEDILAG